MQGSMRQPCADRQGGISKKILSYLSSAVSSLKISPSAEGRGLHYGLTLLLRSILRMLLKAFVCLPSFALAECCMLNSETSSSLPPEDMQMNKAP